MLRREIQEGADRLRERLRAAQIPETLDKIVTREDGERAALVSDILHAFQRFAAAEAEFGAVERRILALLGLEVLAKADWWSDIVAGLLAEGDRRAELRSSVDRVWMNVRFALEQLPRFIALLERDDYLITRDAGGRNALEKLHTLTLVLPDEGERASTPRRLVEAIGSIEALYGAHARLAGRPAEGLTIVACDSGADKVFEFAGLPDVIAAVKDAIVTVWQRVVFYQDEAPEIRTARITESLPVLGRIASLAADRTLTASEAEALRTSVVEGVTRFLEAGALIPEIERMSRFEPRAILQPKESLLLRRPDPAEETRGEPEELRIELKTVSPDPGLPPQPAMLGEEEEALVEELLWKARRKESGPGE